MADVDPDALARVTRKALAEAEKRLVIRDDPDAHQGTIRSLRQGALDVEKRIQANDKKLLSDRLAAAIKHAESKNQDPPQGRLLPHQTPVQEESPAHRTTTPPTPPSQEKREFTPPSGPAPSRGEGDTKYYCDICPAPKGTEHYSSFVRHFEKSHGIEHPTAKARAKILYPVRFPVKKKDKAEATTTPTAAE